MDKKTRKIELPIKIQRVKEKTRIPPKKVSLLDYFHYNPRYTACFSLNHQHQYRGFPLKATGY